MPIEAGKLNRRVTLYPVAQSRVDGGAVALTRGTGIPVWARVEVGVGSESVRGGGELNRQPTNFTIRARADVGPQWQVGYKGRFYEVENVAEPEDGLNEYLVLTAYAFEAGE